MGRSYHLSKKIMQSQAQEIISEVKRLPKVKRASYSADMNYLEVETDDQAYVDVMSRAVNIFRRIGDGCELSFSRFV